MSTRTVSIVGSGHTQFGRLDATLEDLIVAAAQEALDEAGLDASEVDAVYLGHFNSGLVPDGFASSLIHQVSPKLRFKPATRCENACASGSAALFSAMNAISAGEAEVVLVVGAEKMTSRNTQEVTQALAGAGYQNDPYEASLSFPQLFGLAAQQYSERYHCPLETMAHIAAKNHQNALRNPLAQMQRNLDFNACNTVSERNPLIAPSLRLTDCSLITDGAAAVVLVSPERAKSFQREVVIKGKSHISDILPISSRDLLTMEGAEKAITYAMKNAGVGLQDLSFAEVHDCFTIAELLIYEAMGITPRGQGHRAISEGTVLREGSLPVNLSGGLKAKGHPVGATGVSMHAISYRQLTNQAGDMQLDRPELSLTFNMGGTAVANYATVLEAKRV